MIHIILAASCLGLLLVIALQDYLYPPLRNETISAGLTGPYHVLLDISYVPLAASLLLSFTGWMNIFATVSAVALVLVAVTNTAWRFVDSFTNEQHAKWHSRFTLIVFIFAFALQIAGDHGWRWGLTALNAIVPGIAYAYFHYNPTVIKGVSIAASPAAEKLYVAWLCIWLILI